MPAHCREHGTGEDRTTSEATRREYVHRHGSYIPDFSTRLAEFGPPLPSPPPRRDAATHNPSTIANTTNSTCRRRRRLHRRNRRFPTSGEVARVTPRYTIAQHRDHGGVGYHLAATVNPATGVVVVGVRRARIVHSLGA